MARTLDLSMPIARAEDLYKQAIAAAPDDGDAPNLPGTGDPRPRGGQP